MALALIEFIDFNQDTARFSIDIGTNHFYKIKIGKTKTESNGIRWADEIIYSTALKKLAQTATFLNTRKEISVPKNYFSNNGKFVQLFSFKSESGKSPAFSNVITIPTVFTGRQDPILFSLSNSTGTVNMYTETLNDCRNIPVSNASYSYQTGFEEILGKIIEAAGPLVKNLISQSGQNGQSGQKDGKPAISLLNTILNSLLNGFGTAQVNPTAKTQSLFEDENNGNRFMGVTQPQLSQPFIAFAAIAPFIGPIIEALPKLLTAANEHKLKMRQENNKLNHDIFTDVNKRMMLLQILQHMPQNTPVGGGANVEQLMQLLQQLPETPATAQAASGVSGNVAPLPEIPSLPPVPALSLSQGLSYSVMLSTSAILAFDHPKSILWNGSERNILVHGNDVKLNIKLTVPGKTPKTPLAKAIVKVCFKDKKTNKVYAEKVFRQKNVMPNSAIEYAFTKDELASLPVNIPLNVFSEMRWKTIAGKEIKALGSAEYIFSSPYFIRDGGKATSEERELKDMKLYKSFWNKIWESPVLDSANQRKPDQKKYRWSLDANGKYLYNLTAAHDSNGLMDTKFLMGEKDQESLTERTEGRLKAGMELSVSELNKLNSLWSDKSPLPKEKLVALNNEFFCEMNTGEFVFNFKLDGGAKERGMIWVVPVFKLHEFTLSKIKTTNANGHVTETEDEKIQFPLPVGARILGLKNE